MDINLEKNETQEAFDKLWNYKNQCGSFFNALIDAYFKASAGNRRKILMSLKEDFDRIINSKF